MPKFKDILITITNHKYFKKLQLALKIFGFVKVAVIFVLKKIKFLVKEAKNNSKVLIISGATSAITAAGVMTGAGDGFRQAIPPIQTRVEVKTERVTDIKQDASAATSVNNEMIDKIRKELETVKQEIQKAVTKEEKEVLTVKQTELEDKLDKLIPDKIKIDLINAKVKELEDALKNLNSGGGDKDNKNDEDIKVIQSQLDKLLAEQKQVSSSSASSAISNSPISESSVSSLIPISSTPISSSSVIISTSSSALSIGGLAASYVGPTAGFAARVRLGNIQIRFNPINNTLEISVVFGTETITSYNEVRYNNTGLDNNFTETVIDTFWVAIGDPNIIPGQEKREYYIGLRDSLRAYKFSFLSINANIVAMSLESF